MNQHDPKNFETARKMSVMLMLVAAWFCSLLLPDNSDAQGRRSNRRGSAAATSQDGAIVGSDPTDSTPLVERNPFIEIKLDRANKSVRLHVEPKLKDGNGNELEFPIDLSRDEVCVFRFLDETDTEYEIAFSKIVYIKTFEDMVLEQAEQAMQQENYFTAFKNYIFLYNKDPRSAKLKTAIEDYLYKDGKKLLEEGRYVEALTALEELYERNPRKVIGERGGLPGAIGRCYVKLIEANAANRDLENVRAIIASLEKKYGDRQRDLIDKWKAEVVNIARSVYEDAKTAAEGDDGYLAHEKVRLMVYAAPEIEEAPALFGKVVERFPIVFVGTNQRPDSYDSGRVDHWADRRVGRLTHHNLFEFERSGDEGGKYSFPSGKFEPADDTGYVYRLKIDQLPGSRKKIGAPVTTAYDVSARILRLGKFKGAEAHVPWVRMLPAVKIESSDTVSVRLRYPHVLPQSLLQVPYRAAKEGEPIVENGVYHTVSNDEERSIFELNPSYDPVPGRQHPRIIEKYYASRSAATVALERGEIDIIDRVFPTDIARLKANPNITVQPYTLPTVHMLIPNPRNEFVASRDFKAGLMYSLNRENLLKQMLSGGQQISGFELISGPLPLGSEESEQMAYGFNFKVRPLEYNTYLGVAMIGFSEQIQKDKTIKIAEKLFRPEFDLFETADPKQELLTKMLEQIVSVEDGNKDEIAIKLVPLFTAALADSDPEEVESRVEKLVQQLPLLLPPKMTIVHPADDLAKLACESISRMWSIVGVETRLVQLPPGKTVPENDDYDFLYAEITMQEPLVDIAKVVGEYGLAKNVSASINQELERLGRGARFREVAGSLRAIHGHVHAELAVLPLWQIFEHVAYRKNMKNLGSRINYLYQNVENWQLSPPVAPATRLGGK